MKNFRSDYKSKDRKGSSKKDFGDRNSKRLEMHDAICDECGEDCQVPFKPSGGKPVLCSRCFDKQGDRDDTRSGKRSFGRNSFSDRDSRKPSMYSASCDECGEDCQVPFKPTGDKPVYCSDCFERKGGKDYERSDRNSSRKHSSDGRDYNRKPEKSSGDRSISQLNEKIESMNTKLDKLISLLSKSEIKNSAGGEKPPKKTKKPKQTEVEEIIED